MAGPSTNPSFKNTAFANVSAVDAVVGQTLTVEFLTADPSAPTLATTSPRIWINTATGLMKFTFNTAGTPVRTVTST